MSSNLQHNGSSFNPPDRSPRPWDPPGYGHGGYEPPSLTDRLEKALDVLQRRKWIILGTCLLVMAAAIAQTLTQETTYTASSLVLIADETSRSTPSSLEDTGEPFAYTNRSLESELILLRNSEELAQRVAERLVDQEVLPSPERPIPVLIASDSTQRDLEDVTSQVRSAAAFELESKDAKVIRIIASSADPDEATLIAGLYLEEYLAHSKQASRGRIAASRQFLEQQAMMRRAELLNIEQQIQEFQREHGAIALDNESSTLVSRMASAEAQRDEAQLELRQREATLASLEEQLAAINPEQLSERMSSGAEMEIEALQSRIAELEVSKKEIHLQGESLSASDSTRVAQIEERIQRLRADVANLSRSYVDELMAAGGLGASEGVRRVEELQTQIAALQIETSGLEARIAVLSDRMAEYETELSTIPERAMTLAQLQRDRSYEEQMYQYLMQELQETRIQEESELGYASRVTEAAISARPIEPGTRRTLVMALFFGLLVGIGLAFVRDRLDRRLYKPDDLQEKGYSVVCIVPNLKPLIDEQSNGKKRLDNNDQALSTSLVSQTNSLSPAAEAYRSVRTNILFNRNGEPHQTLLVTSPNMGDGKSVTAANLAIVMAQTGRRTLLIDADLRRPRLHELFGATQRPGLSDLLSQTKNRPLCIQETSIENLHLLPSGPAVANSTELLSSQALQDLLRIAEKHFDFIVIDTPPVLLTSDAALFSTQCDGTIVVARAGATTDAELESAMQCLDEVGAHVVGTLFNGFDLTMAYGYKLRYRHYSRYGSYGHYEQYGPGDR